MRSYNGVEHRHEGAGSDTRKILEVVEKLIGFRPVPSDLDYSLSFYAGGTGIDDRLAVRCRLQKSDLSAAVRHLRLVDVDQVAAGAEWLEELRWLMDAEDSEVPLHELSSAFIEAERRQFQDHPTTTSKVFFSATSDVNSWCVVWLSGEYLNYLSFDQG